MNYPPVHVQGMGLLGSFTANLLDKVGVPFTWYDNLSEVNAWQACTGCCYPSGGELDWLCYSQWLEWIKAGVLPDCFEVCDYWVDSTNKGLPHGLKAEVLSNAGGMRHVEHPSVHVNAQSLVRHTRSKFASRYAETAPKGSRLIVAHGFSKRLERYLWGWSRLIRLEYDIPRSPRRPSFYMRRNRFQFAYCYPQARGDCWFAGSSLISQLEAKSLAIEPKYKEWKKRFLSLTGGVVKIVEEGECLEGWRPCMFGGLSSNEGHASDLTNSDVIKDKDGTLYFPVMASNGFRHYPRVWSQLSGFLGVPFEMVKHEIQS